MIAVVIGPGGVGKGTLCRRLAARDDRLWLSRSWTTRARRPGEAPDAYHYVDRPTFEAAIEDGRFLEWAEFVGNLYGTPWPDAPEGKDLLLEIEVQGARQIKQRYPDALTVLLLPPSTDDLTERMRARGDSEEAIARRVEIGRQEELEGRDLADHVVVNDDLDRAVAEVAGILESRRAAA